MTHLAVPAGQRAALECSASVLGVCAAAKQVRPQSASSLTARGIAQPVAPPVVEEGHGPVAQRESARHRQLRLEAGEMSGGFDSRSAHE